MKTALAIRHVPFEDLGILGGVLEGRGFSISYVEAPSADFSAVDALSPEIVVVLGGPIGVYEEQAYPFLTQEIALIEKRLAQKRPTLGICLGCQLMARALGAPVYPSGTKEIGWGPLRFSDAAANSCLAPLAERQSPVLHWHGDTFDLPEGAIHLAGTDACPNQAISLGKFALALQFHLEATEQALEAWFVGHACEIAATPGISTEILRADTHQWSGHLEPTAKKVFDLWIDGTGL
ncbi:MAG: glutamine amidotransferase [Rhodospirillales bacterium]|jgi:GMP synthase (glutamine-hydrolysing)|nr:glutamine amidotransferase [Rhodospirillales bacterium]